MTTGNAPTHTCSYFCDKPECIKAQRDELRDKLAAIRSQPVPVEPDVIREKRSLVELHGLGGSDKEIIKHIDALLSRIQVAQQERDGKWHRCPSCNNDFKQPFLCTTCGAEKLYDATLQSANQRAEQAEAKLAAIRSQPVPVEPYVLRLRNGFFCEPDGSHSPTYGKYVRKNDYDSLQSALKVAQQDCWNLTEKVIPNIRERAEKAEAILIQHYCDYEFKPTLEQAAEMMLEERNEKKALEAENAALREDAASLAKAKEIFKHMAFRENWSGDDISIKRTENSGEKIGIFLYSWGRSPWMVAREFLDEIDTAIFNAIDQAMAK